MLVLDTKKIAPPAAADVLCNGSVQFDNFFQKWLVDGLKPLEDATRRNEIKIWSKCAQRFQERANITWSLWRTSLASSLGCLSDVQIGIFEFFKHKNKNQACPLLFRMAVVFWVGIKIYFACLEEHSQHKSLRLWFDVVLDFVRVTNAWHYITSLKLHPHILLYSAAVMVQMLKPATLESFS